MKYSAYAPMKLPPIWAEFPPFVKPDMTKRNPPTPADMMDARPSPDAMRTPRDCDQKNDIAKVTTPSAIRRIPSNACHINPNP